MFPPRIAPLTQFLRYPNLRLPPLPQVADEVRLFVVIEGGGFGGRRWHVGDLVACRRRENQLTGQVMLEARGLGRPRLGTLYEGGLYGDAGEACSPARWRVAGEVIGVLRPNDRGQLGEPGEGVRSDAFPGWSLFGLTDGGAEAVLGCAAPFATSPALGGAGGVAPLRVVRGAGFPVGANAVRAQLPLFRVPRARAA